MNKRQKKKMASEMIRKLEAALALPKGFLTKKHSTHRSHLAIIPPASNSIHVGRLYQRPARHPAGDEDCDLDDLFGVHAEQLCRAIRGGERGG